MWVEVKKLTSLSRLTSPPLSISVDSLNQYYSSISSDSLYSPPPMKQTATQPSNIVTEFSVFYLLSHLKATAVVPDRLPFWFLRLAAPFISEPLTHLINLSLLTSEVPLQWKAAIIRPIPKISTPTDPSHMRPISVVSVLSRLTERLVIRTVFTPALISFPALFNQFAYRPTSSTTAALIALLDKITSLLRTNSCVVVLSFDYSKAFDTLSHTSVATALSILSIPDNIYNWSLDFLKGRTHQTISTQRSSFYFCKNISW